MSRQSFVNMALSYLDVKEGSAKHKYIIDTYNDINPLPQNYRVRYTDAWCTTFVSAIAKLCGLLNIIPAECSCVRQIELWKQMGRWVENDAYVPKMGDIIYYSFSDNGVGDCKVVSDHVGIVISVSGNSIKVIEGNYSDSVKIRTITVNGKYIRGYGCPAFKEKQGNTSSKESVCNVELKVLKLNSKGKSVKALQALLIGFGYSCGKAGTDGDFGPSTLAAVKKYQKNHGLEPDGVVGQLTWASILL